MKDIAIVGFSGRFPGAATAEKFWENLISGRESIRFFTERELREAGVPEKLLADPNYVRASPFLDGIDQFDAAFFDISKMEAEFLDPQQRIFLQCAWEALEKAGYAPDSCPGNVGVFAGSGGAVTSYLLHCLERHPEIRGATGSLQHLGNDKDFLPTRVSYKLGLKGPSVCVQTACSTSLVSVHLACQSILSGDCDMALAGGVSVRIPQVSGYLRQEGHVFSTDGHCRPFDADASGIIFGSGAGIVVLKTLEQAQEDGDVIYAVIKGSAVNNDGGPKLSYTAASVSGQVRCMTEAITVAGVEAETIGYVEAHGTGTKMGDPVELAALTQTFRKSTARKLFCGIGSVKSNVGHLDVASGITSLIKTVMALHSKKIPASINFKTPNSKIDFKNSPFFVVTETQEWKPGAHPRRAAVNALGMGGTNAFVVLEEAPEVQNPGKLPERPLHVLTLSAKSPSALAALNKAYSTFLSENETRSIGDICATANRFRSRFKYRSATVLGPSPNHESGNHFTGKCPATPPKLAFLFSAEENRNRGTVQALYETQPYFRKQVDRCAAILSRSLEKPILPYLFDGENLTHPIEYAQLAKFVAEFALYELWKSWGVRGTALMGFGIGEIVAACAAEAIGLEDGLKLAIFRARLLEERSERGNPETVPTTRSSRVLAEFEAALEQMRFSSPRIPLISGATGRAVSIDEMKRSSSWLGPFQNPAQVEAGLQQLHAQGFRHFLEIGPETSLSDIGRRKLTAASEELHWFASLRRGAGEWETLLQSLALLSVQGVDIDWKGFDEGYPRRFKVALPTYPFETQRFWIEGAPPVEATGQVPALQRRSSTPLAFLFSGQGSQYSGMAQNLYRSEPEFRKNLDLCAQVLEKYLPRPLLSVVFAQTANDGPLIDETLFTQPALFSVEYALFKLWDSWGVKPQALMGHSVGELVAACAAGVFSLEDGLKLVYHRARLMQELQGDWQMAAVSLGETRAKELIRPFQGRITIAALNGPENTVLAGEGPAVREALEKLKAEGLRVKLLKVSRAFHSAQMEPILDQFERVASEVAYSAPRLPVISNLTGKRADPGQIATPAYWRRHVRECVRFAEGVQFLWAEGFRQFLELGPGTTLVGMARACLSNGDGESASWLASLKSGRSDETQIRESLEQLRATAQVTTENAKPLSLEQKLSGLSQMAQSELIREYLQKELANLFGLPSPAAVAADGSLMTMGMDSLLSIEFSTRLRRALGEGLSAGIKASFALEHSTVRAMTEQLLQDLSKAAPPAQIRDISREGSVQKLSSGILPASSFQERMMHLYLMRPQDTSFNTNVMVRIKGPVDSESFQLAMGRVIQRHDVLRTTFSLIEGQVCQKIAPKGIVPFHFNDLSSVSDTDRFNHAVTLARSRSREPFDLENGPLHRVDLFRFGPTEHFCSMTASHAISDFFTYKQYLNELGVQLEAMLRGETAFLDEPSKQYGEFAREQRERMTDENLAPQLAYWKGTLADSLELIQLPTDRPRPGDITRSTFELCTFDFPVELSEALTHLSRRAQSTFFVTALTALQVLLSRYSGATDICVGVPVTNRDREDLAKMMGPVINTLVIRGDLSGDPTFLQLLAKIQRRAIEAYANADVTIERLLELLQPKRSQSFTPLFQVLFNLVPQAFNRDFGPLSFQTVDGDAGGGHLDLQITLQGPAESRQIIFKYNQDLFDGDSIERIWSHFQVLVRGIAQEPELEISKLPLLTSSERDKVLKAWNQTAVSYQKDSRVHELFEAQAALNPSCAALKFQNREMTYRELDQAANRLARHLRERGVKSESLVGVCLERSPEMVIALLAIHKAGGAYVPLDPSYPKERLAYYLEDSRARTLITGGEAAEGLDAQVESVVRLDRDEAEILRQSSAPLASEPGSNALAYVLYTSGSTGKPKGVQIEHRSVVNFLESMRREPGILPKDVLVSVTSLSFDIAGLEIFLPLSVGAKVVIASREEQSNGMLLRTLADEATIMQATPATWRLLIEAKWEGNARLKILCGGEALPVELVAQLRTRCESLWNMYGPTETTIWSTLKRVDFQSTRITIGRPIANTVVYILDRHFQPVPIGVTGEVLIGGDGLARGYHERLELTAQKFVADPFAERAGARFYRTGDLGRFLADGEIECLGRMDHQIKIRGFRVELGEVEAVLLEAPGVGSAMVLAHAGSAEEPPYLVGFVIPAGEQKPRVEDLRSFLKKRLPDYMVPAAFSFRTVWPLTPNGKVDRERLLKEGIQEKAASNAPDIHWFDRYQQEPLEKRKNLVAELVIGQIRTVLSFAPEMQIGLGDDLIRLGMDSMFSVQLRNGLRKAVGPKVGGQLPSALVFSLRTVGALIEFLCRKLEASAASDSDTRRAA